MYLLLFSIVKLQYNVKAKLGRGFTLAELKGANINPKLAVTIGIAVDHRRTNKSEESFNKNVARLADYKARLIVFPKKNSKVAKGDSSLAECKEASQLKATLNGVPKRSTDAVSIGQVTEEMQNYKAYFTLRQARNEARLVGVRQKKAKEAAKKDGEGEGKPAAE